MDKIWLVLATNKYSTDDSEKNTVICRTKEEAIKHFKSLSKSYLEQAKSKYKDTYNLEDISSFEDYSKRADEYGDTILVNFKDSENEKLLYTYNTMYDECDEPYTEEFIIHMYACVPGERHFTLLSVLDKDENKSNVDDFYQTLLSEEIE